MTHRSTSSRPEGLGDVRLHSAGRRRRPRDRSAGHSGIYVRLTERGFGPVRFTEDVEVRGATDDEAKVLRIPRNQPIFVVLGTAGPTTDRPLPPTR